MLVYLVLLSHILALPRVSRIDLNCIGNPYYQSTDRGPFGDALAEMDGSIGKLIDFVDKSGVREDTMIIFSSDNG